MHISIPELSLLGLGLTSTALAAYDPALVGTWTSKSGKVLTGPGFYNPVEDRLIEPDLTGISYSFTIDGFYEEAYYRAISNPTQPACPSGIMQWQHGIYSLPGNGSLLLQPFDVDGRQLMSSPCSYDNSVYTRYSQPEMIKSYQVETDGFHNIQRLNLYRFDGSPQIPLFLAYNPPQMLPTQTLNPTKTGSNAQATSKSRVKRDIKDPAREHLTNLHKTGMLSSTQPVNADKWWWFGVGLTALGTVMYMLPTSS